VYILSSPELTSAKKLKTVIAPPRRRAAKSTVSQKNCLFH
jgi:hypothetical protein